MKIAVDPEAIAHDEIEVGILGRLRHEWRCPFLTLPLQGRARERGRIRRNVVGQYDPNFEIAELI
jgi:hypothetical protein